LEVSAWQLNAGQDKLDSKNKTAKIQRNGIKIGLTLLLAIEKYQIQDGKFRTNLRSCVFKRLNEVGGVRRKDYSCHK
jgi:hypothetical protein